MTWMDHNLAVQGYCLAPAERRRLWLGLRVPTGLCLPLVAAAIALRSQPMLLALSGVALVAGLTPRHPFDLVWNHALRRAFDAPPLPPNPMRRRHAFKIGAAWLLAVVALLALGAETAALVVGGLLLAACTLVTATNFCVPSYLIALATEQRSNPWRKAARS